MLSFSLKLSKPKIQSLRSSLARSEKKGDYPKVKRILAILLVNDGQLICDVALLLNFSAQSIRGWIKKYGMDHIKVTLICFKITPYTRFRWSNLLAF